MCLIVFAHACHPRYRLILAANRDEFRDRPSQSAHWWDDAPIFAGRDLVAGGTWLALSRDGRLGAVTNVRNPADQVHGGPTRGQLIVDYLVRPQPAHDYAAALTNLSAYAPFNLLLFDAGAGVFLSNRGPLLTLPPGIHALSNASLDTPWPKVLRARAGLERLLPAPAVPLSDALFTLLADRTLAADAQLPATGVPLDWERRLSAIQVGGDDYGTRSTTVVLIEHSGRIEVIERTFANGMEGWSEIRDSWSA